MSRMTRSARLPGASEPISRSRRGCDAADRRRLQHLGGDDPGRHSRGSRCCEPAPAACHDVEHARRVLCRCRRCRAATVTPLSMRLRSGRCGAELLGSRSRCGTMGSRLAHDGILSVTQIECIVVRCSRPRSAHSGSGLAVEDRPVTACTWSPIYGYGRASPCARASASGPASALGAALRREGALMKRSRPRGPEKRAKASCRSLHRSRPGGRRRTRPSAPPAELLGEGTVS